VGVGRRDRADERPHASRQPRAQALFGDAGIDLVDYKLEFGHPVSDPGGPLVLGDEFTPDGCRLWDARSGEKMDKDRFRRDLGSVIEHYREVGRRIGAPL
jgi:phosphoribosylaminoimidazole-succinocarboxamide synthase